MEIYSKLGIHCASDAPRFARTKIIAAAFSSPSSPPSAPFFDCAMCASLLSRTPIVSTVTSVPHTCRCTYESKVLFTTCTTLSVSIAPFTEVLPTNASPGEVIMHLHNYTCVLPCRSRARPSRRRRRRDRSLLSHDGAAALLLLLGVLQRVGRRRSRRLVRPVRRRRGLQVHRLRTVHVRQVVPAHLDHLKEIIQALMIQYNQCDICNSQEI